MPRGREQASVETWRERVRRWKESGLSSSEFAKQEGISRPQALSYWAYQLKRRGSGVSAEPSRTQVLRVMRLDTETSTNGEGVEIIVPSGARIIVQAQSDDAALATALRALGVHP
jgi:transposase